MSELFLKLLNQSLTASWLILAVFLVRIVIKKAPKWINCVLWALVALRLVCPFSIKSGLSLIPVSEMIPYDITMQAHPAIDSGIPAVNSLINPAIAQSFTPNPTFSVNPLQIWISVASFVWLAGTAFLLLYGLISFLRLKRSVCASILLKDNIMVCDEVKSPFILGIINPIIYLPSAMSEDDLACVVIHEKTHIQRCDHLWKPLGYLILAVYWFNPICWISYILLCRDIEMACDEKVIRDMDKEGKAAYSQALLNCNYHRRRISACPVAFGEVGVKVRVKSVLNYRKPSFWLTAAAAAACITIALCFGTNNAGTNITKWDTDTVDMRLALKEVHSISVQYEKESAACYGTDTNRFLATLDKIRISRNPVSKSRAENRESAFVVTINDHLELHFNGTFGEVWVDNGVKPSYSYEIINPETAKELLLDMNFTIRDLNTHILQAILMKIENGSMLVYPIEGSPELASSKVFRIPVSNMEASPEPEVGDALEIIYEGGILETYPAMLEVIKHIRVIHADTINDDTGSVVISGDKIIPAVVFSENTPLADIEKGIFWVNITPSGFDPFRIYSDGYEQFGYYQIYDVENYEPLDFFHPSGMSPQTYIFQNAQYGHSYIVTLRTEGEEMICFGAKLVEPIAEALEESTVSVSAIGGADAPQRVEIVQSENSVIAFELEFSGNTSLDQHFSLSEEQPYWEIEIHNEGTDEITVEIGGTVYRIEHGAAEKISADHPWSAGTYSVSFASLSGSGMHGFAVCRCCETINYQKSLH